MAAIHSVAVYIHWQLYIQVMPHYGSSVVYCKRTHVHRHIISFSFLNTLTL